MNIKKEFVNAIISLFRLEKNVFIIGALEKIIEDVESRDYVMLLAFLGDRDSEYERPIESITKGVEEFYEIKNKPLLENSKDRAIQICSLLKHIKAKNKDKLIIGDIYTGKDGSHVEILENDIEIIEKMGGYKIMIEKASENFSKTVYEMEEVIRETIRKKSITEKIGNKKSNELIGYYPEIKRF